MEHRAFGRVTIETVSALFRGERFSAGARMREERSLFRGGFFLRSCGLLLTFPRVRHSREQGSGERIQKNVTVTVFLEDTRGMEGADRAG